ELFVKGNEPGSVSEKFDKLEKVTDLNASYDEENEVIQAQWDHEEDDVEFKVSAGIDGSLDELTTSSDKEIEISNVEKGATYTIEVMAVNDDMESDPVTVTVNVPVEVPDKLSQVSQLQQTFDPENRSALISWEYEEMENIQFEVVVQLQGNTVDQFTTGDKSINITNLEGNNNYKVQVTPVLSEA